MLYDKSTLNLQNELQFRTMKVVVLKVHNVLNILQDSRVENKL